MLSKIYAEAIAETLDILEHTQKADVDKIPVNFINYLRKNASKSYVPHLDHTQKISDMKLNEKTRVLLAIIYRQYWCTEEEKLSFDTKMKENEAKYQKEISEKFDNTSLFVKNVDESKENENIAGAMVVYKEPLVKKVINKLKSLFEKNKI